MKASIIRGKGFEAQLVRSTRRKSLAIEIKRGSITVRAPQFLALHEIQNFIDRKSSWVQSILEKHDNLAPLPERDFSQGMPLWFLGESLTLNITPGPRMAVKLVENQLHLAVDPKRDSLEYRKKSLASWYKNQALEYLSGRVSAVAQRWGFQPRAISCRYYKSRWGSCTKSGDLKFNWLIMMAPKPVVDYVVVHELCHLKHFNHSKAFWQLVESIQPDYQVHKQWLNQQTHLHW